MVEGKTREDLNGCEELCLIPLCSWIAQGMAVSAEILYFAGQALEMRVNHSEIISMLK